MEQSNGASGTPDQNASGVEQELVSDELTQQSAKDSVAYDTYKRTLAEAKKAKARANELEDRNNLLEQEKLAAEGKDKELIESLRKQLEQTKGKVGNLAYSNLQDQLGVEALKFGCIDTETLAKVVNLEAIEIDNESLRANVEDIRALVEEAKKTKPYLFSKPSPKFSDGVPASGQEFKVDVSKFSQKELKEYLLKNFK